VKEINFGVIGAGFMGSMLARIGCELPYATLKAVADIDGAKARALTRIYGGTPYQDYCQMLEKEPLDAVIVATPEPYHRDPAVKVAEAGCHLFVEKPLASTLSDADAIINACQTNKVKLMVGYILRFEACYAKIKEALDEGGIGRFLSAYARRNVVISEAHRLAGRTNVIIYLAVHDIDQILWYNPKAVRSVYAKAVRGKVMERLKVPDYCWIFFAFEDGSLGVVESGWALPETWASWKQPSGWRRFGDVRMNVIGTEGVLSLDYFPMNLYSVDAEGWKFPDTRHWPTVHNKITGAAKLEMEHFFQCLMYDKEPLVGGREARRSLEVALAAERSIAEGREIRLPLE